MNKIIDLKKMQTLSASLRKEGKTIGFVPTMGFLHQGHLSLMKEAGRCCDHVVVSIFVNPLQFGPEEDFEKYPRDTAGDALKCEQAGVDTLFLPGREEMIAGGGKSSLIAMGKVTEVLCGASRPGHFQGVATIVLKLLNLVQPHLLFLGEKDFQQTVVLKKMVRDFFMPVQVEVMPTVREADGLAMSSRNSYLTTQERKAAVVLYRAMKKGEERFRQGERKGALLKSFMIEEIQKERGVKIDYLEIVHPETLDPVEVIAGKSVVVLAVWVGKTRLIDNIIFLPSPA